MMIKTKYQLKNAYELLLFLQKEEKKSIKLDDMIIEYKKNIRNYHKRENEKSFRICFDADLDGFIERIELPSNIKTQDEAEEYFRRYEYIEYMPSQYDCTGQLFTSWYKIFKINNKYYAYHRVCRDV